MMQVAQVAMDTAVLTLESLAATSILNFAFEVVVSELLLRDSVVFDSSFLPFLFCKLRLLSS
jgi:hypothetical protein